jgi:hypothetical protein
MSWSDILQQVAAFRNSVFTAKRAEPFYRGHADHTWTLSPGLFRYSWDPSAPQKVFLDEGRLYWTAVQLGSHLMPATLSPWQTLFILQHHGMPTRLLDWTESFATALWFALSDSSSTEACVWMLNPYRLNEIVTGSSTVLFPDYDFTPENGYLPGYEPYVVDTYTRTFADFPHRVLAIAGISGIPRLLSQRGVFTLHRDGGYLREADPALSGCFEKIMLPRDLVEEARQFLSLSNTHSFTIFPDLYGLTMYLRRCVLGQTDVGPVCRQFRARDA